jgi:hypothetical protein
MVWNMRHWCPAKVYRRFGSPYRLRLQGPRVGQAGNQREKGPSIWKLLYTGFFLGLPIDPEKGDLLRRNIGRTSL